MTYRKVLVDNITCNRRFHVTFDDEEAPVAEVALACLHCGQVIFQKSMHPPARLARDESLVKTTELSPHRVKACRFSDSYSARSSSTPKASEREA